MGKTWDMKRPPTDAELLADIDEAFRFSPRTLIPGLPPIHTRRVGIYRCEKCGRRSLWASCVEESCPGCDHLMDGPEREVVSVADAAAYVRLREAST